MQTKQKIQRLLEAEGVTPNHRRGQNFLIDLNLMQLLINTAQICDNDIVLEVGCGTGSLTETIAELAGKVIAADIDPTLARIASKQLQHFHNVELIETDILESKSKIDSNVKNAIKKAENIYTGRILLVSNLPYSISSPLMINMVTSDLCADAMFVTVQKEVAQRMTASPGSKNYGTLSIFLAAAGDIKIVRILKPTVFWPQPQVESAMVSFIRKKEKVQNIKDMKIFRQVVNLFMQHRRKMLKACIRFAQEPLLSVQNFSNIFSDCGIDPHERPEKLYPEQYVEIANLAAKFLSR